MPVLTVIETPAVVLNDVNSELENAIIEQQGQGSSQESYRYTQNAGANASDTSISSYEQNEQQH